MTMHTILRFATVVLTLCALVSSPSDAQDRRGYVLRSEGRLVFIDLGVQDEVIPNDLFSIVRQESIIHPVTGENLGGEVLMGMVRVIEIFNRYSTAEILNLSPGIDLRVLDTEARQGLIRVKSLTAEEEMDAQRVMMRPATTRHTMMIPSTDNPDGPIKGVIPQIQLGGGSKVQTNLPDSVFGLISDPNLLAQAANTDSVLENINSSLAIRTCWRRRPTQTRCSRISTAIVIALGAHYPLSNRTSLVGDLSVGARSKLAVGAKFYTTSLFGTGAPTPNGRVGEPAIRVTVGFGGKGSSSLPIDVTSRLIADPTLAAPADFGISIGDSTFIKSDPTLTPQVEAQIDSSYRAVVTDSLRVLATDSLSSVAKRGLGIGIGMVLPITNKIKMDLGMERFGSIEEYTLGLTYYMRPLSSQAMTNPDGVLRSWIFGAQAVFDTKFDKTYLDLNVTYPLTPMYTVAAGFTSNFGGFNHFGVTFRGYIDRM